jgi:hypothetical protein
VLTELRRAERLEASYAVAVRPIDFKLLDNKASITNLNRGGLCFVSTLELVHGDKVEIDLPPDQPVATLKAKVVWCRPQRDKFSVGAEFVEMSEARRARIFEMHKAINAYQQMNDLSGDAQQATVEWLSLYAEKFLAGAL